MYSVPLDRQRPGAVLLLIDQSTSMEDPYGGGDVSKAEELARAVNRLIRNLVIRCEQGNEIRDYYQLGIIGYGDRTARSAFGGQLAGHHLLPISTVASYPLRLEQESMPDRPDLFIERPVWVEPHALGGTPMTAAMDLAGSILVDWVNQHKDSFPPIVVNISDGEATDADPRPMASQLKGLHTGDGNLLLFNVHISDARGEPVSYPASRAGLPDRFAETLFEMSSELTPYMRSVGAEMGHALGDGSRGFMFNANAAQLGEFLDIGTRVSHYPDR